MVTTELVNLDALEQDALAICDRIERALAAAEESSEVIEIRDEAERMAVLARIRGLNRVSIRLTNAVRKAEIKWARITLKQQGRRTDLATSILEDESSLTPKQAQDFRAAAKVTDEKLDELTARAVETGMELTRNAVIREGRRVESAEAVQAIADNPPPPLPEGQYATIVVDPPWPIKRTEREINPYEVGLDYPVMALDEISGLSVGDMLADDAFVFLWTTQRFLPDAFPILAGWGVKYRFTMVWHKPGGFQVFNMPQFNGEFIVVGVKGNPQFLEAKAFNAVFNAPRRGHSVKPDEFYALLRRVAPEPRLDMFSRREIEGFTGWGNE